MNPKNCRLCHAELVIVDYTLMCWECGLIVRENFEEEHHQHVSNYKPGLHFQTAINCIFGEEMITAALGQAIKDVKKELDDANKNLRESGITHCEYKLTNIEHVRWVLKKIGRTKYYKHATAILREISEINPPDIPYNFRVYCRRRFNEVHRAYMRCFNKPNSAGYGFIIYKIFDGILTDKEHRRILDFIHLPLATTLDKRNEEWKIISKHLSC